MIEPPVGMIWRSHVQLGGPGACPAGKFLETGRSLLHSGALWRLLHALQEGRIFSQKPVIGHANQDQFIHRCRSPHRDYMYISPGGGSLSNRYLGVGGCNLDRSLF